MIKSKKELKRFIKEEIYKTTGVKVELEDLIQGNNLITSGNGRKYFGLYIFCPSVEQALENDRITFDSSYAKKDYFKEGFILSKEDIKFKLEDTIAEIKELLIELNGGKYENL